MDIRLKCVTFMNKMCNYAHLNYVIDPSARVNHYKTYAGLYVPFGFRLYGYRNVLECLGYLLLLIIYDIFTFGDNKIKINRIDIN